MFLNLHLVLIQSCFLNEYIFMCMDILPECMSVGHVHVVSMEGRRVTPGCEPPCGFWVLSKVSALSL